MTRPGGGGRPPALIYEQLAAERLSTDGLPPAPDPPTEAFPLGAHHWQPERPAPRRRPSPTKRTPAVTQPAHVQTRHPYRKLGLRPPHTNESLHPRLKLRDYLDASYPFQVPSTVDYSLQVSGWGMMGNDQLGDCTAAAAGHAEEVWSTYGQGVQWTPSDQDVIDFYSGSTGYVPGDPSTDQGGIMQDVLAYWRKTGIAGRTLEAFFQLDPANADELRAALYLFGCVNIGMAFPAYAMDQFDAGQPWDVPGHRADTSIEGGHCVLLVKMTKGGNYTVVSWGQLQQVTPAFWARYMSTQAGGEAWAMAEQDWVRAGSAPANALSVDQLNADFKVLTGQDGPFVATPAPDPTPTPDPTPVPSPPDPTPTPSPSPAPDPSADRTELLRELGVDLAHAQTVLDALNELN